MLYGQLKHLYTSYMIMKPIHKGKDYTYKAGGLNVTATENKRDYR